MGHILSDAVVIGSGPNGLAAAIVLAQAGAKVTILEAHKQIGGGMRTAELTLKGFKHDVCSSVHPLGRVSPFFNSLPLGEHGLKWIYPEASVAHPLDNGTAVLLTQSAEETAERLGRDGKKYLRLMRPFLCCAEELMAGALTPLQFPKHPLLMARFGFEALRSAESLAARFYDERSQALIAGCAAHAILPLDKSITAGVALMFLVAAHMHNWPLPEGGSQAIGNALASYFTSLGGKIVTNHTVRSPADLPAARLYLFDTSPNLLVNGFNGVLPASYLRRLSRFRYGPGVFKIDYALSRPIPWRDENCLKASTVHLGGTFGEIAAAEAAVWRGEHPEKPYVLLTQQSQFDKKRAPKGKHTLWAYCHVPHGSATDMAQAMENQIERFAPGFRKTILKRTSISPAALEAYNANYPGGAITGGVADIFQFVSRPVLRLNPYTTPNPRILLCSASTPPGGGVHGMCGFNAAQTALTRLEKHAVAPLC